METKCVTTLVFKDGKKEASRTLDGFFLLPQKAIIHLSNPINDKSDIDMLLAIGEYRVQDGKRIYEESAFHGRCLEIRYFLSKIDK